MVKIKFKLKQHTPLIHFQENQATLRASELKPKFDRFLKKYVFNNEISEDFKIDNTKDALNYKVKILADVKMKKIEKNTPLFFGIMGDNKKYFSQAENIEIEFFSFNEDLLKIIKDNFEKFLSITNFGTRQSKGYGSFYLDKEFNKELIPFNIYSFKTSNWEKDISLFYRFLRQGINLKNKQKQTVFYSKPFIWYYFKNKGITWEKKKIKQEFFQDILQNQVMKYGNNSPVGFDSGNYRLVRDLFGLSSNENWRIPYKAKITKQHPQIERFPSPLTFKVINNMVYLWGDNEIMNKILNKRFRIKYREEGFCLYTPNAFDFNEFFKELLNIDLKDYIEDSYHHSYEFRTLNRILNDIKASK